jgi:hypothetical protein
MDNKRGVVLRSELLRAGVASDEVRQRRRRRELANIRRGAYVDPLDERLAEAATRHRLAVEAVVRQLGQGTVVSHVSAAVLFGLPVWGLPLERVHVTRDRTSGARVGRDVHLHAAALHSDEITVVDGIAVTTPARAVLDVARSLAFEPAVALADAALAQPRRDLPPLTTPAELACLLERGTRRPGTVAARRVVAFADGRSGSVGESRSRVAIDAAGLPSPVLQWEVYSASGMFIGRVDFAWPAFGTVAEFDGKVKYGRLLRPGQDPGEAVYEEKLREDALRDEDLRMVRWGWLDIDPFTETAARLRRAFRA